MNLHALVSSGLLALTLLSWSTDKTAEKKVENALPITGTWVNFAYKDVRNKYTNPEDVDMTDPALWRAKVGELHEMGMEVLVLMEVANEEHSYYPSKIMPPAYDAERECPVYAVLDEAGRYGMKVFVSSGWARDQFENIRDEWVQERQRQIMEELTELYADMPAFYGWYLPVEDCITPIFSRHSVEGVNRIVARARELTPDKKTLISPYGMVQGDWSDPEMARNIRDLDVDIIAYQDEIGCVREPYPLPRLAANWAELAKIHADSGIEMWANCETFTWEAETNSLFSALIPAAYERLLQQQVTATKAGVSRIISFMFPGIIETPGSEHPLGEPEWSNAMWKNYMAWKGGDEHWKRIENIYAGEAVSAPFTAAEQPLLCDGALAAVRPDAEGWVCFEPGQHTLTLKFPEPVELTRVSVRTLDCQKDGIAAPVSLSLYDQDGNYLTGIEPAPWPHNRHDAWVDLLELPCESILCEKATLTFFCDKPVYLDEIFINL